MNEKPLEREPVKFVCIRKHYWGPSEREQDLIDVGEIRSFVKAPNRHWSLLGRNENVIEALRKKLEEINIVWGKDWGVERLQRELDVAERYKILENLGRVKGKKE